jgi:hypothetical protein
MQRVLKSMQRNKECQVALHCKKISVRIERVGAYDRICYPLDYTAELVCRLVKSDYLTDDQVKILELLGFEIECEEQTTDKTT